MLLINLAVSIIQSDMQVLPPYDATWLACSYETLFDDIAGLPVTSQSSLTPYRAHAHECY